MATSRWVCGHINLKLTLTVNFNDLPPNVRAKKEKKKSDLFVENAV